MYYVWHAAEGNDHASVPAGKYLVDDQGKIRYLVDPGINGNAQAAATTARKCRSSRPARPQLIALITDGILHGKLPWTLVLIGVFIAVVLELCGVPSLPFAVGVYLPLSSSTPIFVGGLVRYVVEHGWAANTPKRTPASETESETSPGCCSRPATSPAAPSPAC